MLFFYVSWTAQSSDFFHALHPHVHSQPTCANVFSLTKFRMNTFLGIYKCRLHVWFYFFPALRSGPCVMNALSILFSFFPVFWSICVEIDREPNHGTSSDLLLSNASVRVVRVDDDAVVLQLR
jgi:hypothetical protein